MENTGAYQISPDITYSSLDGSIVLLKLDNEKYFSLNEVGSRIWQLIEQGCGFESIVQQLSTEYEVDKTQLLTDVERLLENLVAAEMIEPVSVN